MRPPLKLWDTEGFLESATSVLSHRWWIGISHVKKEEKEGVRVFCLDGTS